MKNLWYKTIAWGLCFIVTFTSVGVQNVAAQGVASMPAIGTLLQPSRAFTPVMINGMTLHPDNPFQLDFLVDEGDEPLPASAFKAESQRLINYFMATLTVPDDEMWVNLSPYENNRVIPEQLSLTEMGRDMLVQDYMLKQLTASLMYPEEELGQAFWTKVYAKAHAEYGTTQIPTDTFHKVWIVPEQASVYVHDNTVFIKNSHLKVMLERDYIAAQHNRDTRYEVGDTKEKTTENGLRRTTYHVPRITDDKDDISSKVIKEIILPAIEQEVNHGQTFANLRQIYHSMILASWYKENLNSSILNHIYSNQNNIDGLDQVDAATKDKVYQQYVDSFKQGVYDYIKEETDPFTQETLPRHYFSGGLVKGERVLTERARSLNDFGGRANRPHQQVSVDAGVNDTAMNAEEENDLGPIVPSEIKKILKYLIDHLENKLTLVESANDDSTPFDSIADIKIQLASLYLEYAVLSDGIDYIFYILSALRLDPEVFYQEEFEFPEILSDLLDGIDSNVPFDERVFVPGKTYRVVRAKSFVVSVNEQIKAIKIQAMAAGDALTFYEKQRSLIKDGTIPDQYQYADALSNMTDQEFIKERKIHSKHHQFTTNDFIKSAMQSNERNERDKKRWEKGTQLPTLPIEKVRAIYDDPYPKHVYIPKEFEGGIELESVQRIDGLDDVVNKILLEITRRLPRRLDVYKYDRDGDHHGSIHIKGLGKVTFTLDRGAGIFYRVRSLKIAGFRIETGRKTGRAYLDFSDDRSGLEKITMPGIGGEKYYFYSDGSGNGWSIDKGKIQNIAGKLRAKILMPLQKTDVNKDQIVEADRLPPYPEKHGPLYTWVGVDHLEKWVITNGDVSKVQPHEKSLIIPWASLFQYDEKMPFGTSEKVYRTYTRAVFGNVSDTTAPENLKIIEYGGRPNMFNADGFRLVRVSPNNGDEIYVVDYQPMIEIDQKLWANKGSGQGLSNNDIKRRNGALAKTMVPIHEYQGGYQSPVVLIGRSLAFDEIELMPQTVAKRDEITRKFYDTAMEAEVGEGDGAMTADSEEGDSAMSAGEGESLGPLIPEEMRQVLKPLIEALEDRLVMAESTGVLPENISSVDELKTVLAQFNLEYATVAEGIDVVLYMLKALSLDPTIKITDEFILPVMLTLELIQKSFIDQPIQERVLKPGNVYKVVRPQSFVQAVNAQLKAIKKDAGTTVDEQLVYFQQQEQLIKQGTIPDQFKYAQRLAAMPEQDFRDAVNRHHRNHQLDMDSFAKDMMIAREQLRRNKERWQRGDQLEQPTMATLRAIHDERYPQHVVINPDFLPGIKFEQAVNVDGLGDLVEIILNEIGKRLSRTLDVYPYDQNGRYVEKLFIKGVGEIDVTLSSGKGVFYHISSIETPLFLIETGNPSGRIYLDETRDASRFQKVTIKDKNQKYSFYNDRSGNGWRMSVTEKNEVMLQLQQKLLSLLQQAPVPEQKITTRDSLPAYPPHLGPLFTWMDAEDVDKFEASQGDVLRVYPHERAALRPDARLISLGSGQKGMDSRVYNGYIWAGFGTVMPDAILEDHQIYGFEKNGYDSRPMRLVQVNPRHGADIFIVDYQAIQDYQKELIEKDPNLDYLSDEQLRERQARLAATFIPITEYNGDYKKPTVLIGRDVAFDEVVLFHQTAEDRLDVSKTLLDSAMSAGDVKLARISDIEQRIKEYFGVDFQIKEVQIFEGMDISVLEFHLNGRRVEDTTQDNPKGMIAYSDLETIRGVFVLQEFAANQKGKSIFPSSAELGFTQSISESPDDRGDAIDVEQNDHSMITKGGIDLNTNLMNLDASGDVIPFHLDPALLERFQDNAQITITPTITHIQAVPNLPLLLGFDDVEGRIKVA